MATTQDAQEPRFSAGLSRRWRWGWGKRELINLAEAEAERRWAGLAEWLRVAHLLLDEKPRTILASPVEPSGPARIE